MGVFKLYDKKFTICCNVNENRIEQCCAAHSVQGLQQYLTTLLHLIHIQQYCLMLVTTINDVYVGSTILLNPATAYYVQVYSLIV